MAPQARPTAQAVVVDDVIVRYYDLLQAAAYRIQRHRPPLSKDFTPAFRLPKLDTGLRAFFDASLSFTELELPGAHQVHILDLMRNPATRSTKTLASLTMISRAVEYIRSTGESLLLVTPTSGNKGTALRDAIGRAIQYGLVEVHQLRIVTVVPQQSAWKIRSGVLSADPALRELNPVLAAHVKSPADVKGLASDFAQLHARQVRERTGARVWYSLDLDNYRLGDATRAFAEAEFLPPTASGARVHAHAVSSGYGLLGYSLGHAVLDGSSRHPAFLLVQGLSTPDMVLNLLRGSFSRAGLPQYRMDSTSGLLRQNESPHFPAVCQNLQEHLDPTFYTHEPPTSPLVNQLIREYGGSGIVVSRAECDDAYPDIRRGLLPHGFGLPEDSTQLREWSLVKVLTGTLLAVLRGIVAEDAEIVVHGTGAYWDAVLAPYAAELLVPVTRPADIMDALAPGHRNVSRSNVR